MNPVTTVSTHSNRLVSLDAFRGFTMAAMVLVNNGSDWGRAFPQLAHARWDGWTFTDLIFPFFLWISGMSTTYSVASRRSRGDTTRTIVLQILRRSVLIFLLGVFLNGFPFGLIGSEGFVLATLRIPGVLQRIALCYFFGSLLYLFLSPRWFWVVIAGLFLSYWGLMMLVPVPGLGAGMWEPGKNFAAFVDQQVFGSHMWGATRTWDPEGIVSTIPAIATFLLGILGGEYLRRSKHGNEEKTAWFFVTGGILLFVSVVLDMWIPINKNLWTPSYVLMMAGWAQVVFAFLFFLIDIKSYRKWATPLLCYGMNAIFIYALSSVLETLTYVVSVHGTLPDGTTTHLILKDALTQRIFSPYFSPMNASLLFAIATDLFLFLIAWGMWKKMWFVKI